MAKQLLRTYTFTPGAAGVGVINLPGKWDLSQLLVITNVTRNTIIYNFADSTYSGTTISFSRNNTSDFPTTLANTDGVTTITLGVATTGQASTDSLQIFIERNEVITRPWPMGTDAFERTRVASPQSMLDADFEYGLQPTKWQTIETMRNYPSIYEVPGTDVSAVSILTDASWAQGGSTGGGNDVQSQITVTLTAPHYWSTGSAVTVNNVNSLVPFYSRAQGAFIITSVPSPTQFTYYAKGRVGTTSTVDLVTTFATIRKGGFYTGASIGSGPTFSVSGSGAASTGTVTVTFPQNHGLIAGQTIVTVITSDNGSNNHTLTQGSFYVISTPSLTTITYLARGPGAISGTPLGIVYPRPDSYFLHRPFDGGVTLGTGGPSHGYQAIRMSKKYIRYQSGKAVNYNTGALFAPNYDLRAMTATNTSTTATFYVTTDDIDHGLQIGAGIQITGIITTGYSGYYNVNNIIDERTFTVTYTGTTFLSTTTAAFSAPANVIHTIWHGATIRAGTFDEQNGIYWQFDGQQMVLGQRASTFQCAGTVNCTPDSNLITGNFSRFDSQLQVGDRVVIKGMMHLVTTISSSTWMYVNPDYRGSTATSGAKMTKVFEKLYPQSQWNVDRCDGSNGPFNPSGYYFRPTTMQMIGLQWTWYGAGFIDWMLRGSEGNYITVHRQKNSNVNTEAYMRSGNMPVRYEIINEGARSTLVNDLSSVGTVMTVTDLTYFPSTTATVYIDNEFITYTGKSASTGQGSLTGLTRNATLTYFAGGSYRNFTAGAAAAHTAGVGLVTVSQTATPSISHWGSAFLTDGGFDNDRGYIFNYAATNVSLSTTKTTAFGIRLAPSVSNAAVGDIGIRELINRAQLLLQNIEITAGTGGGNQAIVIEGVLNPSNYPSTVTNITWSGLQSTGQPSFSQIAATGGIIFDNFNNFSTTAANTYFPGSTQIQVASTGSIQNGDAMTATTSIFQGGTVVNSYVGNNTFIISKPIAGLLNSGAALSFTRGQYALPGETIFSFIASPANKDSLDLSPLKELTNTPLGGRGTFPNGPDCLFINAYLTSGTTINANLVLRWGEAQA